MENQHPGFWRIEVEPVVVQENLVFLHTIKIGDNTNPASAGGKLFSNESTLGVDWENHLYLFHAKGDTASVSYSVQDLKGDRTIKIFALDLKSNTSFGVFVDEVLERTGNSNSEGIFDITLDLTSGNHSVVVRDTIAADPNPDTDPDPDPSLDEPGEDPLGEVKVYPNPNNGEFSIVIEDHTVTEFEVNIYDSKGRKISQHKNSSNRSDMDLSGLSAGIYFLLIQYLGKTVQKKIVVI